MSSELGCKDCSGNNDEFVCKLRRAKGSCLKGYLLEDGLTENDNTKTNL